MEKYLFGQVAPIYPNEGRNTKRKSVAEWGSEEETPGILADVKEKFLTSQQIRKLNIKSEKAGLQSSRPASKNLLLP